MGDLGLLWLQDGFKDCNPDLLSPCLSCSGCRVWNHLQPGSLSGQQGEITSGGSEAQLSEIQNTVNTERINSVFAL